MFLALSLLSTNAAQPVLPNSSFEDGLHAPSGWRALEGGTIRIGAAHSGQRSLHGKSRSGASVWRSDPVRLQPRRDYRLEGWLRCAKGEARVGLDLTDETDRVLTRVEAPPARSSAWRYVAVEWNPGEATLGRVWFWVKGEAHLDDVQIAPVETSYIGNPSAEGDERGRIPFWNEERTDALRPGRRAGEFKLDPEIKRDGKTSVQVRPTGDWFAIASVNYPVAPWTDRHELSGWARCGTNASAQILACWTDDAQNVLRVDESSLDRASDWQRVTLQTETVPERAMGVRLVAVARGGPVWFDDFQLLRLRPRQARAQIHVNQIGYELNGPKSAVVASNFFPQNTDRLDAQLIAANGRVVWKNSATCGGRIHGGTSDDWGWYFWRVDFSEFHQPGSYRAALKLGAVTSESAPFLIDRHLLLTETAQNAVDFFHIQRCGFEVQGWHKACHLDDAKLPDGTHLDATGGWHSAGDYNKLMYEHGDGGVVYALLACYGSSPARFERFDRDHDGVADVLDEARWGAAFVAKMQIPETGGLRNHVSQGPGRNWTKWSAPEVHTDNTPGTADDPVIQPGEGNGPLAIGGWARLSARLDHGGITNDYLARAERLWDHATKNGAEVKHPYLLLSAIELHQVTGKLGYLDGARRGVEVLLSQQTTNGPLRGAFGSYGDSTAAALAQFALTHTKDEKSAKIKRALREYANFCVGTADNPFGLSPQTVGATNQFFPADLGNNFQVLSRAWAAALGFRVTHDPGLLRYAQDHVDWVLGKNPANLCMFEGQGMINPPRYHHRYNMIPGRERGAVPGTIPNGFVRDMGLADRVGFDLSRTGGRAPSYRTSEPWLVHNLFYLLAASALDRAAN